MRRVKEKQPNGVTYLVEYLHEEPEKQNIMIKRPFKAGDPPMVNQFVSDGQEVFFRSYRDGIFYYDVARFTEKAELESYEFQVPMEEIKGATLLNRDKAIAFMRWIRKNIENKTFIKVYSNVVTAE